MAEFIVGNALRKAARQHGFLQRLLWRVDFALVWSLVALFRLLPVDWASRFGAAICAVVGPMIRGKTALIEENFRTVFPEKSPDEITRLARNCWRNAGRVLGEFPHLDRIYHDRGTERLEVVVQAPDSTFVDRNRPAVVVGAHLSNWELAAVAMGRLGIASTNLYSPVTNPWLDRLLRKSRAALRCELLPRDNSARQLLDTLKSGRTVGMIIDRRVDEGKPIPFFGREKNTTLMPAKLAVKFGCDLIPARVERTGGVRFRVTFFPPIRPRNLGEHKGDQAVDMTRQVHELFETWIRDRPEDWFCATRLWPKTKKGALKISKLETESDSYVSP